MSSLGRKRWSGRSDSNTRPPRPERGALPGCATTRHFCHRGGKSSDASLKIGSAKALAQLRKAGVGPCLPKTVLYQAELHSATDCQSINRTPLTRNRRRRWIHLSETPLVCCGKPGAFIANGRKSMRWSHHQRPQVHADGHAVSRCVLCRSRRGRAWLIWRGRR